MKRWRRRPREDDSDEEDDDEEQTVTSREVWRETFSFDTDDDEEFDEVRWAKLEKKVRAGRYRPRPSDPWGIHVLYNNLRDLGDL